VSEGPAEALARLPHGAEFRFIDRITSLDPGKTGTGEYVVAADAPFLRGHFPGNPLFPGVLLIEAAAQLAGCVAQSDPAIKPLAGLKLTAVRSAKILGSAAPGRTLLVTAQIDGRMAGLIQASATVSVDGKIVLQAQLTLSGTPQD
jgi:3-hydroxyacyl-[acyl-carrier-protein] dehydratase